MSDRSDTARQTGPAVEAMYRSLLWLVPTVEKFPRRQKFLIGDRLPGAALAVLELPIGPMPPRPDDPFGGIVSFQALLAASQEAIRGKRRKPGGAAFLPTSKATCRGWRASFSTARGGPAAAGALFAIFRLTGRA